MDDHYETDKKRAVKALKLIDSNKPFGTELFNAIARVSVSIGVEAVCLRVNMDTTETEVLLIQRSLDDSAYPGEWHCPGSVMRPGEKFSDVFERLAKREFLGKLIPQKFVGNFNNATEARGHFLSVIYLCSTDGAGGTWYPLDTLPEKTVDHHRRYVIPMAARIFSNPISI